MQFIEVDPNEIPNYREGRRGRVSYPILKSFLETGKYMVQIDRTGVQQSFQSLYSCLNAYVKNHGLPIKLFSRQNQIYLVRTDLNVDGTPIQTPQMSPEMQAQMMPEAPKLTGEEVQRRFSEEVNKSTK